MKFLIPSYSLLCVKPLDIQWCNSLSRYYSSAANPRANQLLHFSGLGKGECEGIMHGTLWPLFTSIIHCTEEAAALGEPPSLLREKGGRRVGKPGLYTHHSPIAVDQWSKQQADMWNWRKMEDWCSGKGRGGNKYDMQCSVIYLGEKWQWNPNDINEATGKNILGRYMHGQNVR